MADNVIELNGKRYDALSGAYLGPSFGEPEEARKAPVTKKQAHKPKHSGGRAVDGFIRPTTNNAHIVTSKPVRVVNDVIAAPAHARPSKPATPKKVEAPKAEVKTAKKIQRSGGVEAKPHKPEHAKTLMRRSVHKPKMTIKPAIKTTPPAEIAAKSVSAITVKRSALQVDETRLERAATVAKHQGVRHFTAAKPSYTPAAIAATPKLSLDVGEKIPVIAVKAAPPPVKLVHKDIFEAAIAKADSHKQPHVHAVHRAHRRKLVNWSAGIAAFVLIGAFFTYLNVPNIELHVASVQAGFTASMPGYKPTGYALKGGVERSGNAVSLKYQSGENHFTITQQASDWNSQTLVDNTLGLSDGQYKTVEAAGRTVYLYGDNNASWVNAGVRYDLSSNTPLSTGDITHVASSM